MVPKNLALAFAASLALVPTAAQAQACVDRATVHAAADLLLPALFTAVANRCGGDFAAQAPVLAAARAALVTRFDARANAAWPRVRDWLLASTDPKLAQARDMVKQTDNAMRLFVGAMGSSTIDNDLKPQSCATVDAAISGILPLGDDQIGNLMDAILRAVLTDPKTAKSGFVVCLAPPAAAR